MSDHLQSLKRFKSATSSSENTDSSTIASTYLCKHNTKYKYYVYNRLGEILEKWSDSVCYLSIVIVCVNLKNATPILMPRPNDDVTRPS